MNLLVSGVAVLLACGVFVVYDASTFRDVLVQNLITQARLVGATSARALVRDDPAMANVMLAALRASPNIVSVHVFTMEGRLFARYGRDGEGDVPAVPAIQGDGEAFTVGRRSIGVARPVLFEGTRVGTISVESDAQVVYDRLLGYGLLVGVVLPASLLAALLVSRVVRRGMATPLVGVAAVARRVADENDYSQRASVGPGSSLELTTLVEAFNEMLTRIQARDHALEAERASLDERVRARTAELAATNQDLEAFTYSVSHDLRSPLRHISGFASMLTRHAGSTLDERGLHYLTTITGATTRMGQLIDDLLAFSRMGRANLAPLPVELDELVREAMAEVSGEVNGRTIQWDVASLPAVVADPALMRPALVNLLSNAVKYTALREDARIEVGATRTDEGEVVVFVRDNGVGFDMAYVDKLFGVFQRLHRQEEFSGTGIGLANVRRIIQRHGGRTWAEGEVGRGATFYFSLPEGQTS